MKYILIAVLLFSLFEIKAETSYDNLQVSLLTVAPRSNEIYTIFGHTALCLYDPVQNIDTVLNWGTFNTEVPHFLFRFIAGKTDYFLSASPRDYFYYVYTRENVTVTQQFLDIPNENKEILLNSLLHNLKPENCEYRYNFLFDNCTTRPRDIIEKYCGGKLTYPEKTEKVTFRDLIHYCTNPYPWTAFGIDLIIGSGADSLISFRQELFLPEKLMFALDESFVIAPNGEKHPIVFSSSVVIQSSDNETSKPKFPNAPFITGIIVFLLFLALTIIEYVRQCKFHIFFAFLFLSAAIAGCLIVFLSFFSYHPCTQYNWNILWLHPLHFFGLIGCFFKKSCSLIRWYHWTNLLLLSFLLLAWFWIPQQLNPANIPYILCLGLASVRQVKKTPLKN